MANALVRHLITDNAMLEESRRVWRKHVAGGTRKDVIGNYAAAAIVAFAYLWGMSSLSQNAAVNWTVEVEYIELVLLTLIMPAAIHGAIAGEREKATWEALVLTRLTPEQIIIGKIIPRAAAALMILGLLALPIEISQSHSSHLLYGNSMDNSSMEHPSTAAVLSGQAMLVTWAILLIAFGLWVSANSRRSVNAAGTVFGLMLFVLALLPMLTGIFTSGSGSSGANPIEVSLCANPFAILAVLQQPETYQRDDLQAQLHWYGPQAGWYVTLIYIAATAGFLMLTHRRLKQLEEPQRR